MEFSDLEFKPHRIGDGVQAKAFFENGYGASVVRFFGSYGAEQGLYELAVLLGDKEDWKITYDTPLTSDVLGYLSETEVSGLLKQIEAL